MVGAGDGDVAPGECADSRRTLRLELPDHAEAQSRAHGFADRFATAQFEDDARADSRLDHGLVGDAAGIGAFLARHHSLAVEFGPSNVRVNCIAPGLVRTDFARALWENPETLKRSTAGAPLRRIGEPDEIAGAAIYLASKASSFMTGQTLVLDGGVTIG